MKNPAVDARLISLPVRPMLSGMDDAAEYYSDPTIRFFLEGEEADEWVDGPVKEAGYYIMPWCTPMCCRPWGPFPDQVTAREWSRANLVEDGY